MVKRCVILFVLLFLLSKQSTAIAQEYGSDLRLFGQFGVGMMGSVSSEVETMGIESETEGDLNTTYGFGVGADFGLFEYLALGGVSRVLFMSQDVDEGGGLPVIDFDALPRIRYPFKVSEVYLAIPVGLSIFLPESEDTAIGWNISFVLGGLYKFTEKIGWFGEIGYFLHFYSTSEDMGIYETNVSTDLGQVGITTGVAYLD